MHILNTYSRIEAKETAVKTAVNCEGVIADFAASVYLFGFTLPT